MTLTKFLLARIAEDEANIDGDWADGHGLHIISTQMDQRMRAECEAKRRIVELHGHLDKAWPRERLMTDSSTPYEMWQASALLEAMKLLALPYANHPDYDEAWVV